MGMSSRVVRRAWWMVGGGATVSVALFFAWAVRGGPVAAQVQPPGPPPAGFPAAKVSPDIPADPDFSTFAGEAGTVPIAQFDDYSWRTFIALNWPAKPLGANARARPDTGKKFGDPAAERTVWETWKTDFE